MIRKLITEKYTYVGIPSLCLIRIIFIYYKLYILHHLKVISVSIKWFNDFYHEARRKSFEISLTLTDMCICVGKRYHELNPVKCTAMRKLYNKFRYQY